MTKKEAKSHHSEHHASHPAHHEQTHSHDSHSHHNMEHPHTQEHHPIPHTVEHHIRHTPSQTERLLLENFVSLQRVLTNLSAKLDGLSSQMSKLLDVFEISAKALAEKDFQVGGESKDVVERMDKLLEQNKILARGISLMHERMPREYYQPQPVMQQPQQKQQMQQPQIPQNQIQSQQIIQQQPQQPVQQKSPEPVGRLGQRMAFSQEIQEDETMPPKFESPI